MFNTATLLPFCQMPFCLVDWQTHAEILLPTPLRSKTLSIGVYPLGFSSDLSAPMYPLLKTFFFCNEIVLLIKSEDHTIYIPRSCCIRGPFGGMGSRVCMVLSI